MRKYWQIYKIFWSNSLSYSAQYRRDFWIKMTLNLVWLVMIFIFINVLFQQTTSIGGWSKSEVYLLTLFWIIFSELEVLFFMINISQIPDLIAEGNLDLYLTKPANTLFLVSTKFIGINSLYRLIGESALAIYLIIHYQIRASATQILWAIILFACGLAISFSIQLMLNTLSFWFIRIDNINELWQSLTDLSKYPVTLLPKTVFVLSFTLIPIAFFAYVPAAALFGKLPWYGMLYAIIFSILIVTGAINLWNYALNHYSSASS